MLARILLAAVLCVLAVDGSLFGKLQRVKRDGDGYGYGYGGYGYPSPYGYGGYGGGANNALLTSLMLGSLTGRQSTGTSNTAALAALAPLLSQPSYMGMGMPYYGGRSYGGRGD